MLHINEDHLRDLIHRRSRYIKSSGTVAESGMGLLAFIGTLALCDLRGLTAVPIAILCAIGALYLTIFVRSCLNWYSDQAFYDDVVSLATPHRFSILAIAARDRPGRYLLVYDRRWRTHLFPYLRTKDENDSVGVDEYLRKTFGFGDCRVTKTKECEMSKACVSANLTKTYHHTFYFIDANVEGTPFAEPAGKVNGVAFKWHTIDDMKCDRRQYARNRDVIAFVERA